jgi:hypothetical protein
MRPAEHREPDLVADALELLARDLVADAVAMLRGGE